METLHRRRPDGGAQRGNGAYTSGYGVRSPRLCRSRVRTIRLILAGAPLHDPRPLSPSLHRHHGRYKPHDQPCGRAGNGHVEGSTRGSPERHHLCPLHHNPPYHHHLPALHLSSHGLPPVRPHDHPDARRGGGADGGGLLPVVGG